MTHVHDDRSHVALITGASRGLGRALARGLASHGWSLLLDARGAEELAAVTGGIGRPARAIAGDVSDPAHRGQLLAAVREAGRLDLLVNNASDLGPSPLPPLADYPLAALRRVYEVDVVAPLALVQMMLPFLARTAGAIVNISSDAAIEAYPGWGGYGSAKAALDQLGAVLAVERPDVGVYVVDPGDMRTQMHQLAFPGEDISNRPEPETVVPVLLALLDRRPPSGRYRAADLAAVLTDTRR